MFLIVFQMHRLLLVLILIINILHNGVDADSNCGSICLLYNALVFFVIDSVAGDTTHPTSVLK